MNKLKIGYASTIVNPPLGYPVSGYYVDRFGKGFIDDLEASALALSCADKTALIISVDNAGFCQPLIAKFLTAINAKTNVDKDYIFISATHSHTAPSANYPEVFNVDEQNVIDYDNFLIEKLTEISVKALDDLKPAKMGFAVGHAPDRIAYIRRYKMKDGSTWTCPPINDPNIDHPIGELDQRVNVIRFTRENADDVVIMNYGLHADTVNGDMFCSDWVGWVRRTIEKSLDGTKCMCIMGAQGDVGSTNVHPIPGDMNDTEISFDNEMKSPGMARFVGRALAGVILQVYDKVAYVPVDDIFAIKKVLPVKLNIPDKKDLPLARKYKELYESGRSDEIPYTGMQLTTVVAEALRMCEMENDPEFKDLNVSGLKIGNVAFISLPGEAFTDIGVQIKATEGFDLILPCVITNGYEGYFPVKSAYDEGGYEARTSHYTSDIANELVTCAKNILVELKKSSI